MYFQIDQKVEKAWPLLVISHNDKKEKIYLDPGEMLIYESARIPHGRQYPLNGEYYDNIFVHFSLLKD